ncbi:hypothetical protein ABW19_dt0202429 [Dactylella cylindrospora]|nr:hypothetical protein ABW19_dt0202429 [Dactylella cylindrospora]
MGEVGFSQSGQLDWVGLADRVVTVPVNILSRYSQSGIQPYTLEFAQTLGQVSFRRIRHDRLNEIEAKLNQAKVVGFSSKLLYIGTGISAIPRQLATRKGGLAFAIIASALRTCYSLQYSSRVLDEIVRFAVPEDTTVPTSGQLQILCEEVVGVAKDNGFLQMLDILTSMLLADDTEHQVPSADDMGTSILALSSIPDGQSIVVRANPDLVAWLVAYSHHYLGHQVSVLIDDHLLWDNSSTPKTERPQSGCSVVFKTTSSGRAQTPSFMNETQGQLQIFKEAEVSILLERCDREESIMWTNRIPLDEAVSCILKTAKEEYLPDIRKLFFRSLLLTLNCRIRCRGRSIDISIADFVDMDQVTRIWEFMFGKLQRPWEPWNKEEIDQLTTLYDGRSLDPEPVIGLHKAFTSHPRTVSSTVWKLVDVAILLIFIKTDNYSRVLANKSCTYLNGFIANENNYTGWTCELLDYDRVLRFIWETFDKKVSKTHTVEKRKFQLLGGSFMGVYAFSPLLLDSNAILPLEELLPVHVGDGSIFINGHVATSVSMIDSPEFIQTESTKGSYRDKNYIPDPKRLLPFNDPTGSQSEALINAEEVARSHNLVYTLKPYIENIKSTEFTLIWSLIAREGFRLFYDKIYAPLELIVPDENPLRIHRWRNYDPNKRYGEPFKAYFFNIQELFSIHWDNLFNHADCFVLCCERDVPNAVLSKSQLLRSILVPKLPTESLEEFCNRLILSQFGDPLDLGGGPSHVGVISV